MVDAQVRVTLFHLSSSSLLANSVKLKAYACRTMVSQLLVHQRIETTLPKAKELRRVADQVVTISKEVPLSKLSIHEASREMQELTSSKILLLEICLLLAERRKLM